MKKLFAVHRLLAPFVVGVMSTAAVACGHSAAPTTSKTEPPPLAQVSQTPVLPSSTRPPGPAITRACTLAGRAEVAATLGIHVTSVQERQTVPTSHICHYQADNNQYVELWVTVEPATGTADQAVSLAIKRYSGTLQSIPGLGDAAYFSGDAGPSANPTVQTLLAAQVEGQQMRMVILMGFLSGDSKAKLTVLARSVLKKI